MYFPRLLVISPLDVQNWKGHIASLWPLSAQILSHFEILVANIISWLAKRSPAEMGQNKPQQPQHSQTYTSTRRWLGPALSWWMSAREVRAVPVYLSWLPGRSVCHIPTASRLPGSEGTLHCLSDPWNLKGKQRDLTLFQWSELGEYNKLNWMKSSKVRTSVIEGHSTSGNHRVFKLELWAIVHTHIMNHPLEYMC